MQELQRKLSNTNLVLIIRMQVMKECQQPKPNELGCMAASYAEVTSDNGHGDH